MKNSPCTYVPCICMKHDETYFLSVNFLFTLDLVPCNSHPLTSDLHVGWPKLIENGISTWALQYICFEIYKWKLKLIVLTFREGVKKKTTFYGHVRKRLDPPPSRFYGHYRKNRCFLGGTVRGGAWNCVDVIFTFQSIRHL